ncbi:MAG: short-chain dehydrogenase/reductase [Actinomycetia bacterium]|nr:short-chain dehydrogenase/reductase [Actinomycetes bacterium]
MIASDSGNLLEGKVAVITGAGAGIGAATAKLFAAHGAEVVIAEIDPALAEATAAGISAAGGKATAIVTDVRDPDQVDALARAVLHRYERVDVLVNNVGHWVKFVGDFTAGDPGLWDELYRVNFLHVLLVTHAFLPSMTARGSGAIVNVSSVEGLRGYPAEPVYGGLKAAVIQFTRSLAVQVGHQGVRVNAIGPDVTESVQVPYSKWVTGEQEAMWPVWVPVGRAGDPIDQARVILFLASDLSGFVTGHTIPTDGGTGAAGGWFRSGRGRWTNRPDSRTW